MIFNGLCFALGLFWLVANGLTQQTVCFASLVLVQFVGFLFVEHACMGRVSNSLLVSPICRMIILVRYMQHFVKYQDLLA
jgi:hypothetical protein